MGLRERICNAFVEKKARGERCGAIPFGFSLAPDGVKLVPVEHEQRTLARIRTLASLGHGRKKIAKLLNQEGHRPQTAAHWHPTVVGRIMRRCA